MEIENEKDLKRKRNIIIAVAILCKGNWNAMCRIINKREFPSDEEVERLVSSLNCGVITYFDEEYPERLKQVRCAPFVLFYLGDISLIKNTNLCLSVVGTRKPTAYGAKVTDKLISGLSKDIVIVSGMALGIDAIAHYSAIRHGLKTVAVLGSGVDICYPLTNLSLYNRLKKNYLVISEHPPGFTPAYWDFPVRNRIVAGLSKAVLVTEAKRKSGTTTTMAYALEAQIDILCVPSQELGDSACNLCIKDGGYLVENSDDINMFFKR